MRTKIKTTNFPNFNIRKKSVCCRRNIIEKVNHVNRVLVK